MSADAMSVICRAVASVVLLGGLPLVALGLRALVGVALNREGQAVRLARARVGERGSAAAVALGLLFWVVLGLLVVGAFIGRALT